MWWTRFKTIKKRKSPLFNTYTVSLILVPARRDHPFLIQLQSFDSKAVQHERIFFLFFVFLFYLKWKDLIDFSWSLPSAFSYPGLVQGYLSFVHRVPFIWNQLEVKKSRKSRLFISLIFYLCCFSLSPLIAYTFLAIDSRCTERIALSGFTLSSVQQSIAFQMHKNFHIEKTKCQYLN